MRIGSVCSGIGCEAVAWAPIEGWAHVFFSEIAPFPRAVLKHRFPDVPVHGDFRTIEADTYGPIDLLVGGTPCQSFSVAGLRGGLDDDRGNLALEFCRLARRLRPRWICWENVPGVLSSDGGRDFGAILGGLVECGYRDIGWRILDAQFVRTHRFPRAVPQRRRRLFVVGHLGDGTRAAAVLLERESLQGHPPPRRTQGQGTAHDTAPSLTGSGRGVERAGESRGQDPVVAFGGNNTSGAIDVATACNAHGGPHGRLDFETETFVAHSLTAEGFDAGDDGTGRGTPLVPVVADPICANEAHAPAVALAFDITGTGPGVRSGGSETDVHTVLRSRAPGASEGSTTTVVQQAAAVRRLTPRECERLQGLPDDWTLVPWRAGLAADGPRYKAIGNGQAVNVMRWIGRRIELVEHIGAVSLRVSVK